MVGLMLEDITLGISKLLTNEEEGVDTSYDSNPSLRPRQWLLVGTEEVRVSSLFLKLLQGLLVGAEEVRVSNLSLRPWQ